MDDVWCPCSNHQSDPTIKPPLHDLKRIEKAQLSHPLPVQQRASTPSSPVPPPVTSDAFIDIDC